jgi:hypothetical protein
LAPRQARVVRNYAEESGTGRDEKKRRGEAKERAYPKRGSKASTPIVPPSVPLDRAAARAVEWHGGGGLTKKDANAFVRAVCGYCIDAMQVQITSMVVMPQEMTLKVHQ